MPLHTGALAHTTPMSHPLFRCDTNVRSITRCFTATVPTLWACEGAVILERAETDLKVSCKAKLASGAINGVENRYGSFTN